MALELIAGAFVSFGIRKLLDLLIQEGELLQGVERQATELKNDLKWLSSFVKDADAKKHTNERVKNCVEEIKEIIFDGEDIIETFLIKQKLRKTSGIKKNIRSYAWIIPDRRENALDIQDIRTRVSNVIENMQRFGVQQISNNSGHLQRLSDRQRAMRQTFPMDYESDFVGLEANVKELVGYFVKKKKIQIVSITGIGGLGKTTLARQVFNHKDVKREFDGLAWVCVSQDCTRMSVWQKILVDLKPKEEEKKILDMTESTIQDELIRLLETSKSLIVLDDIWKEEDWDLIKPIFPPKKDWKVLLTSRTEGIAMRNDKTYINFKPQCLTTEESWALLKRIAFPKNDVPVKHSKKRMNASESKNHEKMEEMGKQMIKHCGGLPLAVRALGGLLAEKYTFHDWKRVSENIGSQLIERTSSNNGSIDKVLSMSFEELSSYLKQCFLYLAHFPEDHKINIEDLSYYWAAEGISESTLCKGETIRDIGDSYIEELVRRNMVISKRDVETSRYETCHLHDIMRELCLIKAKEENFLQLASTGPSTVNTKSPFSSRRFVLHNPTTLDVERDINNPKIRSLMVVYTVNDSGWKLSGSIFERLKLLRVLDLFKVYIIGGKLPSGIGNLIHLRYLSLKDAAVSQLPASLGMLILLIYLNLDMGSTTIFVPNVLMGMQELRYLALPFCKNKKTKLELSNLVKLETLKNFSTKNCKVKDLQCMVRLRSLSINLHDETSIEILSSSIGGLRNLEDLQITDLCTRNLEDGIVLDFIHLKHLDLDIYMPKLLKEHQFPSHLTIIHLRNCELEEDPMPILEKFPYLNKVSLGSKSFSGRRMVCSRGGFRKLQKLDICCLMEWEEWIVQKSSMPVLQTLEIWNCPKLKKLPDELKFITSLKEQHTSIQGLSSTVTAKTRFSKFFSFFHISFLLLLLF